MQPDATACFLVAAVDGRFPCHVIPGGSLWGMPHQALHHRHPRLGDGGVRIHPPEELCLDVIRFLPRQVDAEPDIFGLIGAGRHTIVGLEGSDESLLPLRIGWL